MFNVGATIAQCISKVDLTGQSGALYDMSPVIRGVFSEPIKVISNQELKIGSTYKVDGLFDTLRHEGNLYAALRSKTALKLSPEFKLPSLFKSSDIDRIKQANCFMLDSLTVRSTFQLRSREYVIELTRPLVCLGGKISNHLHFYACTTPYSRSKVSNLKIGDKISIVGAFRPGKLKAANRVRVQGVYLFDINPSEHTRDQILNSYLFRNLWRTQNLMTN